MIFYHKKIIIPFHKDEIDFEIFMLLSILKLLSLYDAHLKIVKFFSFNSFLLFTIKYLIYFNLLFNILFNEKYVSYNFLSKLGYSTILGKNFLNSV